MREGGVIWQNPSCCPIVAVQLDVDICIVAVRSTKSWFPLFVVILLYSQNQYLLETGVSQTRLHEHHQMTSGLGNQTVQTGNLWPLLVRFSIPHYRPGTAELVRPSPEE